MPISSRYWRLTAVPALFVITFVANAGTANEATFCKALAQASQSITLAMYTGVDKAKTLDRALASGLASHASVDRVEALVNHIYDRRSGPADDESRDELERDCLQRGKAQGAMPPSASTRPDGPALATVSPQVLIAAGELLAGGWSTLASRGVPVRVAGDLVKNGILPRVPAPFSEDTPMSGNSLSLAVSEDTCRAVLQRSTGMTAPGIPKWQPTGSPYGCFLAQGGYRFFTSW